MTLEQVGVVVAIGSVLVGGLAWLFRLQGRLGSHEAECLQFRKRIDERHETSTKRADERHDELMHAIAALQTQHMGFYHARATDK